MLNKSKLLDDGRDEVKRLIDMSKSENKNPIFIKKDLLGVMNMLGTPKFVNFLEFDDMFLQYVK